MYTILIVDDSPMIVDVFVAMLERGGYRPIAAYSGNECLEVLEDVRRPVGATSQPFVPGIRLRHHPQYGPELDIRP